MENRSDRNESLPYPYSNLRLVVSHGASGFNYRPNESFHNVQESILRMNATQHAMQYMTTQYYPYGQLHSYSGNCQWVNVIPQLSSPYIHRPFPYSGRPLHGNQNRGGNFTLNGLRHWEKLADPHQSGFIFSVMSYNVLAQNLLDQHPQLYMYHDPQNLQWKVRWNNILQEMNYFKPDILCLQEVQHSHLNLYIYALKKLGYYGLYKKRTGPRTDGCAIFFKFSKINLLEHTSVEFKQPNVEILNRDNVALIATFSAHNSDQKFIVATTHLLYNPKREDVRLGQMQLLFAEIDRLAFVSKDKDLPVVLTGDLNSTPDSSTVKFISTGKLKYEDLAERSLKMEESARRTGKNFLPISLQITDKCQHAILVSKREDETCMCESEQLKLIKLQHSERECQEISDGTKNNPDGIFSSGTLTHKFRLRSVYQHNTEILATTFQDRWVPVDYIFYTNSESNAGKLNLLSRFRLATRDEVGVLRIPNEIFGSDHFSLIANFQLQS